MRRTRHTKDGTGKGNSVWDDQGGYMNAKIRKLEEQFDEVDRKSSIFSGIRVYVNGYTEPSALEIRRLVQENGGKFVQYYSQSSGDFMIANNLPLSKIKKIANRKVVKASWITESVAVGRLLPWKNFELYPSEGLLKNQSVLPMIEEKSSRKVPGAEGASSDTVSEVLLGQNAVATASDKIDDSNPESKGARRGGLAPTTSDKYISQYYSRSRLHHLSKWAADLRDLVRSLRLQAQDVNGAELLLAEVQNLQAAGQPTETVLQSNATAAGAGPLLPRILMHIDMDCFFVSVCLRSRPEFIGLPVAVTHSKGEKVTSSLSEVASCSYEARRFGVTNGMHLGDARKLCPDLKTVPYEFQAFQRVAEDFYKTVAKFSLNVEAISCDEVIVDVTDLLGMKQGEMGVQLTSPLVLGSLLRKHVYAATGCTATCGFGTNRLLARLATKRAKPDSQAFFLGPAWRCLHTSSLLPSPSVGPNVFELASSEGCKYLDDLSLGQLPGVGRQMVKRIATTFGASTCKQLLTTVTHAQLSSLLGAKTSQRILQLCQGNDTSELAFDKYSKSVSAEINYGVRLSSWSEVEKFVDDLGKELSSRLAKAATESESGYGVVGSSLVVHLLTRRPDQPVESVKFLGHGVCDSFTRTVQLPEATADPGVIASTCLSTLRRLAPNPCDIRGLGLQMHHLSPSSPLKKRMFPRQQKSGHDVYAAASSSITRFLKPLNRDSGHNISDTSIEDKDFDDACSFSDTSDVASSPTIGSDQLSSSHPSSSGRPEEPQKIQEPSVTATSTSARTQREQKNKSLVDLLPHQAIRPIEEVNVFAKRSVDSLQNMFATWVTSQSDPLEEDLCMLADYLISILPTDLVRVRHLLRGLNRLVGSKEEEEGEGATVSQAWRLAFGRLRLTVDHACRRHYDVDALNIDLN